MGKGFLEILYIQQAEKKTNQNYESNNHCFMYIPNALCQLSGQVPGYAQCLSIKYIRKQLVHKKSKNQGDFFNADDIISLDNNKFLKTT